MKLIYIDDSGHTGKKLDDEKQPIFLLGGFIVDEKQWHQIDNAIQELKKSYNIEDEEIHGVVIIDGKRGTPYSHWNYEKKITFFEELLSIIPKFKLPVIYFSVRKVNFKEYFKRKYGNNFLQHIAISPYLLAFSYILQISDAYLVSQQTNGILIFDEQDEYKKPATKAFNILKAIDEPEVKIKHLLENSFFVDSSESNMTQLADVVAYTTKRYLEIFLRKDIKKTEDRRKLFEIYKDLYFGAQFKYEEHPILEWLEKNIGNQ